MNKANEFNVALGNCLRFRRRELGLSQSKLGAEIGITFQQIQKYEKGSNSIPASRLYQLAQALRVPAEYFFPNCERRDQRDRQTKALEFLNTPRALDLLRDFATIKDPKVRNSLCNMAKSLATADIRAASISA